MIHNGMIQLMAKYALSYFTGSHSIFSIALLISSFLNSTGFCYKGNPAFTFYLDFPFFAKLRSMVSSHRKCTTITRCSVPV